MVDNRVVRCRAGTFVRGRGGAAGGVAPSPRQLVTAAREALPRRAAGEGVAASRGGTRSRGGERAVAATNFDNRAASAQAFRCRGSSRGARGGCRGPRPTSRIRRPRSRPFLGERDSTPTRRACSAPARTGLAAAGNAGGANGWKSSAYENTCEAPSECVTGGPWSSWFRRRNQGADMGSPEARGADATTPRRRASSKRRASRPGVARRGGASRRGDGVPSAPSTGRRDAPTLEISLCGPSRQKLSV